jgi:hypothetical protein
VVDLWFIMGLLVNKLEKYGFYSKEGTSNNLDIITFSPISYEYSFHNHGFFLSHTKP